MDLGLSGKKAIVTGSTRGIGRAIAERLLDEGASVAIGARSADDVTKAVEELEGRSSGQVWGAPVDVAQGEAFTSWCTTAAENLGGCDVYVSNTSAGGGGANEEKYRALFEVDLLGLVRGVDALKGHLTSSGSGAIVAISTTTAVEAGPGSGAYGAMKAAVIAAVADMANSMAGDGVRANAVSPGPIYIEGGAWNMIKDNMEGFYDSTVKASPHGRLGSAEEVANVVAFLASPAASWVTGENIVIDGGFTKRVAF